MAYLLSSESIALLVGNSRNLRARIAALEDLEEIRSVVLEFETLKGGVRGTKVDDLIEYFTEDTLFANLDGQVLKGRENLKRYLAQGHKSKIWDRHVVTNLIVRVRGKKAGALYFMTGEGLSRSGTAQSTVVHSNTKSTKKVALRKVNDKWLIARYETEMNRVTTEKLQA